MIVMLWGFQSYSKTNILTFPLYHFLFSSWFCWNTMIVLGPFFKMALIFGSTNNLKFTWPCWYTDIAQIMIWWVCWGLKLEDTFRPYFFSHGFSGCILPAILEVGLALTGSGVQFRLVSLRSLSNEGVVHYKEKKSSLENYCLPLEGMLHFRHRSRENLAGNLRSAASVSVLNKADLLFPTITPPKTAELVT